MANPSKSKGTAFESAVVEYFREQGFDCERQTLSGNKDVGDIRCWKVDSVFELKNCKKLELSKWLEETEVERNNAGKRFGVTIFKRARKGQMAEQFALLPLSQLVEILGELYPEAKQ